MRVVALVAVVAVVCGAPARVRATSLPPRGGMYVQPGPAAAPTTPLAQVASTIAIAVTGPIAEATVTQTFRNDGDRATEATYIFPLPADAAVSAMQIVIADPQHPGTTRTITAAIERRADAQRRYEQAVATGVGAAVLEQERPDVFTQTVAAIPAHGTVAVTLRFDTVARYRDGTWQLVVPLVVAPRFVPGVASGRPTTGVGRAPDTDRAPDASRVTPGGAPGAGGPTTIALAFAGAVEQVTSPSHALAAAAAPRTYTLVDPHSDHDAIVRWRAPVPTGGWVEADAAGGFAAVLLESTAPRARPATAKPLKTTLVIDRAATTRGDGDAVMRPLVRALLQTLAPTDRVAIAGSDRVAAGVPTEVVHALDDAWRAPAGPLDLTRTLTALRGADPGTAIVLVTDGLVADDAAAIAAAARVGVPIHVIGFGPAPNHALLGALAAASGGTVRLAAIGDGLEELAREVIADVATPPAPLAVAWGTLAASDVVPAVLPRLGAGQATLVLARVRAAGRANGRARGDVFAIEPTAPPPPRAGATTALGPIGRRWARDRLDELLAGHDATATTRHALAYGLVSPYTTMVAIGTEVVVEGGVKHSVAIPVSVPAGMRWQEVSQQVRVDTAVSDNQRRPDDARDGRKPPVVAERETADKKAPAPPPPPPPHEPNKAPAKAPKPTRDAAKAEAPAQPAPPTASPQTRGTVARDDEDGDRGGAEADDFAARPRTLDAPTVGQSAEVVSLSSYERGRRVHLALGAGGGFVYGAGTTRGLLALDARVTVGVRLALGVDASVWLAGGAHGEGSALAIATARGLARWLEFTLGAGVHLTGGSYGPALSLQLRGTIPHVRGAGVTLRYDGALLGSEHVGEHAGTLGLEWRF